jgi:hypothetical protein
MRRPRGLKFNFNFIRGGDRGVRSVEIKATKLFAIRLPPAATTMGHALLDPLESSMAAGSGVLNAWGLRRGRSSPPHPRERAVLPQERVDEGGRDVQDDERGKEDRRHDMGGMGDPIRR